jgi:hypothetical protein
METERISLTQRERDRLRALQDVQQRHLTQVEAAVRVKLSDRQGRRLLRIRAGHRASIRGETTKDCERSLRPGVAQTQRSPTPPMIGAITQRKRSQGRL